MLTKNSIKLTLAFCFVLSGIFSCKTDTDTNSAFSVNVRMPSEPESLHPMLSRSSYGVQISGQIMLPPAEFDPVTLELSPLLITAVPKAEEVTSGPHAGGELYSFTFRPEAVWDDGTPVTSGDYLFTVKAATNPYVSSGWKSYLEFLSEIITDPGDPKAVSVYVDSSYIFTLESVINFFIYPEHIYDPSGIMAKFDLAALRDPETQWTPEQDSLLKTFAEQFQSTTFLRETVKGAGPYSFENWVTGEFITIKRKEDWWGDHVQDPPLLLQAFPDVITYHFITDAATAEAALKSGTVDIISEFPAASFTEMKNDPSWNEKFQFITPEVLQIYILDLNNQDVVLADERIRKALAYSLDYEGIMKNLLAGLGERAFGPIHPKRSYFHKTLQPIEQDINKSIALIQEAGWKDSNQNGIPDKLINGQLEELRVHIKITSKEEGQLLASIVRENAKRAGFDVVIETVETSQFNKDVRQGNYDIAPLRIRAAPSIDEPHQWWHSESIHPGGGNVRGYASEETDSVIEEIRTAESIAERDSNYYRLQEILYDDQPVIFLYVPLERIVVSKKFDIISSSRKPGYFENLFRPAGTLN